jgi:hypothetical protein
MATKAERAKYEEERKHDAKKPKKKAAAKKSRMSPRTDEAGAPAHDNARAGRKSTVAKEEHAAGERPARKSTRKSANRAKADSNLVLRAERAARSPDTRARKAKAKATKARGKKK